MKKILIIDNFDSFTFNLADYFKQLGCEVEVHRNNIDPSEINVMAPELIVFSPGPSIPKNAGNMMEIIDLYHKTIPMFGVCLGHQALVEYFGGTLKFITPAHGKIAKINHDRKTIFRNIEQDFTAGRYHSLAADTIPDCFEISAKTGDIVMAIRHKELPIEGVQFHPESVLSMKQGNGFKLIKNLIEEPHFIEKTIAGQTSIEEQQEYLENLEITPKTLAQFVRILQSQMADTLDMPGAIDLCGTGGSGLNRINTSTICSFIASAAEVKIAKHGNKAASGRFGSFDLLENLGININAEKTELETSFKENNLAFIFARKFHPSMKAFAEVRQRIGKKTIFNLMGPLLNPSNPQKQIIGVSEKKDMDLIIEAAKLLKKEHVLVVHGQYNLDEVTLTGETDILELKNGEISSYTLSPADFGLGNTSFQKIAGGDNTKIATDILQNTCKTEHLNLILANSALILKFANKVKTYKEGVKLARQIIESGKALHQLHLSKTPDILQKIIAKKSLPKSTKDFKKAITQKGLTLICELKNASPSDPTLKQNPHSLQELAEIYENNGSAAISIITEENFFKGSLENLRIKTSLPKLMKDFITDETQIYMGRSYGADAILLIAALLDESQINYFIATAKKLGMDAVVEIHNDKELKKVLKTNAEIIGINNRNLHTFEVDIKTTIKLISKIPKDKIVIAESGYCTHNVNTIPPRINAALIGSTLMKSLDPAQTLRDLNSPKKLLKVCGIRTKAEAAFCEKNNIHMVGLNFVKSSHRSITIEAAKAIKPVLKNTLAVGIFQNQTIEEVNQTAEELDLDYVQLSGTESPEYCTNIKFPIIKTIKTSDHKDYGASLYIIDGKNPGSGETYDYSEIDSTKPFLIAGGITEANLKQALSQNREAKGIDIASGIETNQQIDLQKIASIHNQLASC